MYIGRQKVLENAINNLNNDNQPWKVHIEENKIVAQWKWMDARFFSPNEITEEVKQYTFIVTLDEKGKWHELDSTMNTKKNINMSRGKLSYEKNGFVGKHTNKSITIGFGKNQQTSETGIVKFKLDTSIMKKSIREYLKENGWKKAGFFF